jgi:predicted PurR-regulated permease PerM
MLNIMRSLRNRGHAQADANGDDAAAGASNGTAAPPVSPAASVTHGVPPGAGGSDQRQSQIPGWLQTSAAWSWRLLLLGVMVYVLARLASLLYLVVVPCAAAILFTALLQPLAYRIRRAGLPPLGAAWCALLAAIVVLAGALTLVTTRVRAQYPSLVPQVKRTTAQVQNWLAGAPFHLHTGNLQKLSNTIVKYLGQHKSLVEGTVVSGGKLAFEFLGGVVLALFVTFFLLKDGDRIWSWLTRRLSPPGKQRADKAGTAAWHSVVYYVRGTVTVAAIHGVVMGVTLTVMGVPLAAPLALLVFLAAFVPLVGMLVAGALAILVVLATKGWLDAVVLLGIMILMSQLEGHLLQPLVVGRWVRLHPLAVILVLGVGTVIAGIAGAVVAVPITAAISSAMRALRDEDLPVV